MKTQQQDTTQLSKHKDMLCPLSKSQISNLPIKMIGSICRKDHLQRKDHHQTAQFEESWLPLPLFLITRNVSNGVAFKVAITNPKNKHRQSYQKPFFYAHLQPDFKLHKIHWHNFLTLLIPSYLIFVIGTKPHSHYFSAAAKSKSATKQRTGVIGVLVSIFDVFGIGKVYL